MDYTAQFHAWVPINIRNFYHSFTLECNYYRNTLTDVTNWKQGDPQQLTEQAVEQIHGWNLQRNFACSETEIFGLLKEELDNYCKMSEVKLYGAILALFFALMGVATIYSCITSRNDLPLVTLALPEAMEEGSYRVPNQAVQQQGYRHLFVVEEQDGAWGKEYVCREILLPNMSVEGETTLVYADLGKLPVVVSSTEPLHDGAVVRLS